jgi:hypothetical protein
MKQAVTTRKPLPIGKMTETKRKPVNTRLHGIFDYSSAFILLLPWITNYHERGQDTLIFAALGIITALYSLLTDYEFGLVKLIPMKVHIVLDILSALFLIAMPWLTGVMNYYLYWPVLLGVAELVIIFLSSTRPYVTTRTDKSLVEK